ncbi:DMT family transporter [Roseovarius sp. LXJ103]|uniref:DMT family transporter n=1 Tax=Roseovarius carneus TaxID=2853164 RepID=UPI000D61875A|nr:DMT family transporter [Roseovarius carneus]MBZ8119108.1 DMT family transporter [Roseovarius carneus]PWE35256.1 EamA family transporter [Pelagicola sp. LXJ1103]
MKGLPKAERPTLGILLMVGFALTAPLMDSFAKMIGDALAVGQVAATRFAVQAALLLPLAIAMGCLHRPLRAEMGLHLIRAALILTATGFFFYALRYMPIADAIAIFFVEPFILTLLGALLLGEAIGARRILACTVGFVGALLIIQPTFVDVGLVALAPLVTALLFAFYMILTRKMAQRMHPITLQTYTSLAALVIAVPLLTIFNNTGVTELDPSWPAARELWLLLGVGVVATLSHICISYALSFAPASTIAPIHYLEIVSATALGFWIFGDLPDGLSIIGIALIVGSGFYVFLRERKMELAIERRVPPQP